jgi:hypothetical protein
MLLLFTSLTVALIGWWFLQPTARFLRGFAGLLEDSDFRVASSLSHRPRLSGRFNQRVVVLQLHHPADNRFGSFDVAIKTSAPDGERWKDSALVSRNPDISRATFDLEGKHSLVLTLADGWLRASTTPLGVRFPGPFEPDKWHHVLRQMDVLAQWLERI